MRKPTKTKGLLWQRMSETKVLYLFLLPAIVVIFLFNYLPMYGVQIAFKDFQSSLGIWGSPWVGLKHYERLISLPALHNTVRNTLLLSLMNLTLSFPLPVVLALMLNQLKNEKFKRTIQTVTYMPHFISTVVVVGMILVFLSPSSGLYGIIARFLGFEPTNIMGRYQSFRWIYVLSEIWQRTGWNSIIYMAALSSIDPSLYEAAVIDGAGKWKRMKYIDIPYLIPTMVILLILSSGNILNVGFEKVYLMQNSTNISTSEIINTYVYKVGILSAQFSFSTAVSLLNTFINFLVLIMVNTIARRFSSVSLW